MVDLDLEGLETLKEIANRHVAPPLRRAFGSRANFALRS